MFVSQQQRSHQGLSHLSQVYRVQPLFQVLSSSTWSSSFSLSSSLSITFLQHSVSTTELMLRWANRHYDSYADQCRFLHKINSVVVLKTQKTLKYLKKYLHSGLIQLPPSPTLARGPQPPQPRWQANFNRPEICSTWEVGNCISVYLNC